MKPYLDLLKKIMDEGVTVPTGAYLPNEGRHPTAKRLHAEQIRLDLRDGFPAVTTKPLWWRAVVAEWIWFMRGSGDITYLREQKVSSIWEPWVKPGTTDLGPVYGRQFRRYQGVTWADRDDPAELPDYGTLKTRGTLLGGPLYAEEYALGGWRYLALTGSGRADIHRMGPHHDVVETDQIARARDDIRAVLANPYDRARRRIIVTLWNPAQIPAMALPPCHTFHMYDLEPPEFPAGARITAADARETLEIHRAVGGAAAELAEYAARQAPRDDITYAFVDDGAIAACDTRWTLNLHLFARSIDAVKGLPFNIASYALMLAVMARITRCKAGTLTITFNDVHIYDNFFGNVEEQLAREPYPLPQLFNWFDTAAGLPAFDRVCKDLTIEEAHRLDPRMFPLAGYKHHPRLSEETEVAV